jgi:pimeloyl-ACP methyl ester carboxylesterase
MLADTSSVRGMPYAEVNGQRVYFQDTGGSGVPVVLGHGFLMDRSMFEPQIDALGEGYRVITWDARGFGQTEFDSEPFTYWDLAADCLGLLDRLGIDDAVLGGMSQGGFVALRAALLAPDRVRALILLDSQAGLEDPEAVPLYQGMLDGWVADGPSDEVASFVADLIVADPVENQRWIAKWKARPKELLRHPERCLLERDDVTDRLGEIGCPALVVHGTSDTAIPMARAEALAAGLPAAGPVVKVPGAHAASLTHPEQVNDAIVQFLGGLLA